MAEEHQGGDPEVGGDETASGHRADPVLTKGEALAHAGGPGSGEPAAGGSAYASGGVEGRGSEEPSGSRAGASGAAPSNAAAPLVHTAMDDDARASDEGAARGAGGAPR